MGIKGVLESIGFLCVLNPPYFSAFLLIMGGSDALP